MAPLYIRSRLEVPPERTRPPLPLSAPALPYGLPVPAPGSVQLPPGISLCLTVKDDAGSLESCLRSVIDYVDEMCVIDLGSTDQSVEIALAAGARLEQRLRSCDAAAARNAALGMACKRWIFVLNADEQLDDGCGPLLRAMRDVPAHLTGLRCRLRQMKAASAHDEAIRMFPNSPRLRYLPPNHELITLDQLPNGIDTRTAPISVSGRGRAAALSMSRAD